MDNFTIVFETIKQHCNRYNNYTSAECYDCIGKALTGRICLSVDFYLDSLYHTGIIDYNKDSRIIKLTMKGLEKEELFI